jgi:Domain of unknown function (DUF4468) with TBP-like fold
MRLLKQILFYLLMPVAAAGQTVHVDDNRIVYKGAVKVSEINKQQLYERAKDAIYNNVKDGRENIIEESKQKGKITVKGSFRLTTPWELIRKVEYILELAVEERGYKYRIDSVVLQQKERGGKKITMSSGKMLKAVDVTGPESREAEKQLNELDMNFQKILALIKADIIKTANTERSGN